RVLDVPCRGREFLTDPGGDALQDRPEQRLFTREVVVERAAADSRFGEHRLDRSAVVAALGEQLRGDVDQVRPGGPAPRNVLVHAPPRHARPCLSQHARPCLRRTLVPAYAETLVPAYAETLVRAYATRSSCLRRRARRAYADALVRTHPERSSVP